MGQAITDYGTFLMEAKQAVTDLRDMEQRETALSSQLKQSRRQLEAEEKALADRISQTVRRRASDIAASYDKELGKGQEQLKKAKARREKAKSQGIKDRIAEETAGFREENRKLKLQMKTVFQQNHVPAYCRSNWYYRLFAPKWPGEFAALFLVFSCLFSGCTLWELSYDTGEKTFVSGIDLFCLHRCIRRTLCGGGEQNKR